MPIRQKTQKEMITTLRKYGAMKCRYNLWNANLREANLWVFQTTQFRAIYIPWQHLLKIGCLEYPIAYWVAHYEAIGKDHDFSEQEISQYGAFIKLCAEVLD